MAQMIKVICNVMEFVKDQLKTIVEWSKEQRQVEDEYGSNFQKQLQDSLN